MFLLLYIENFWVSFVDNFFWHVLEAKKLMSNSKRLFSEFYIFVALCFEVYHSTHQVAFKTCEKFYA